MLNNSPANMRTGSSKAASGTICLKKLRRTSPRLWSMWTLIDWLDAIGGRVNEGEERSIDEYENESSTNKQTRWRLGIG